MYIPKDILVKISRTTLVINKLANTEITLCDNHGHAPKDNIVKISRVE